MKRPTPQRIDELLSVDPSTGEIRWKKSAGRVKAGDLAGGRDKNGYRRLSIDSEEVYAHQLVFFAAHGYWCGLIDHINRQGLDNRQENLRPATAAQNCWNSGRKRGASGHRGVSKSGNGWVVKLTVNKQMRYFGFFSDLDEAKRVADAAAHQLRGEFDSEPKRAA